MGKSRYDISTRMEVIYGLATAGVDYPELAELMLQAISHISEEEVVRLGVIS